MNDEDKLIVNIEMKGKDREMFEKIKENLGLTQNTEVLRVAIRAACSSLCK